QITAEDILTVKAAGFESVICNQPNEEQPGQPPYEGIRAAAGAAGLAFAYIPVISGQLTHENDADMAAALDELDGPVFAYCRCGARSTNLYMMAKQSHG